MTSELVILSSLFFHLYHLVGVLCASCYPWSKRVHGSKIKMEGFSICLKNGVGIGRIKKLWILWFFFMPRILICGFTGLWFCLLLLILFTVSYSFSVLKHGSMGYWFVYWEFFYCYNISFSIFLIKPLCRWFYIVKVFCSKLELLENISNQHYFTT